jgi:hypothetical protein
VAPLRPLLEDSGVLKVMHDCRGDSDLLFHAYGVRLANVVDTQIAYAMQQQMDAGSTPLPVSLRTLHVKHGFAAAAEVKDLARDEMTDSYWLRRPMTPLMVSYAAADVQYLVRVYNSLAATFSPDSLPVLVAYSDRYVRQCRDLDQQQRLATIDAEASRDPSVRFVPVYGIDDWDQLAARSRLFAIVSSLFIPVHFSSKKKPLHFSHFCMIQANSKINNHIHGSHQLLFLLHARIRGRETTRRLSHACLSPSCVQLGSTGAAQMLRLLARFLVDSGIPSACLLISRGWVGSACCRRASSSHACGRSAGWMQRRRCCTGPPHVNHNSRCSCQHADHVASSRRAQHSKPVQHIHELLCQDAAKLLIQHAAS